MQLMWLKKAINPLTADLSPLIKRNERNECSKFHSLLFSKLKFWQHLFTFFFISQKTDGILL